MNFLSWLFDCRHPRLTFPRQLQAEQVGYVCCLTCGRELPYSWEQMRVLSEREAAQIRDAVALKKRHTKIVRVVRKKARQREIDQTVNRILASSGPE